MSASESPPPKDPRFRPFRGAVYALYLSVATAFCLLVLISVLRSIDAMTPDELPPATPIYSVQTCLEGAERLFGELEQARKAMGDGKEVRRAAVRWTDFRVSWLQRMRVLESHCALESTDRPGMEPVFRDLRRLAEAYSTHAVQYAGEVGRLVDRLHRRMDRARRDGSTAAP